jgi:hypothetical protein
MTKSRTLLRSLDPAGAEFYLTDDLVARLSKLSFSVLEKFERAPYPEVEYPSTRGYILGGQAEWEVELYWLDHLTIAA